MALLSVLAAAGERGVTRDRATMLLWGERDESHARHHLSDALYIVRHAFGPEVIDSSTTLVLNRTVLSSDLEGFSHNVLARQYATAVAEYGGPFLDGFHLTGAVHFEDWMVAKRQQLSLQFCQAIEGLAGGAEQESDLPSAIRWWRLLLEQDPYNSRVALSLARALLASEDRGNALDVLEAHRQLLRSELDADTGVTVRSFLDELRNGDGAVPAVSATHPALPARPQVAPAVPTDGARRRWPRLWGLVAGVVCAALAGAGLTWLMVSGPDAAPVDPQLLAVPPFHAMTANPAIRTLAMDVPELFWATITGEFGLRVTDPTALEMEWRRKGGEPGDALPLDEVIDVAEGAGAGLVVVGSVAGTDGHIRLSASLIEVPDGDMRVAPTMVEGAYQDFPLLVDRLVGQLLARHAGVPEHRIGMLADRNTVAVQAYLSGVRAGQQVPGSGDWFARALDADSEMLLAALSGYEAGEASQAMAQVSWDHRAELHAYDAALALPLVGWRFGRTTTLAERLEQYASLVNTTPLWSAPLVEWGASTFLWSRATGATTWSSAARAANENLVGRDPNNLAGWSRLFAIAAFDGDTASARRYASEYTRRGAHATESRGLGWLLAWTVRLRLALLVGDAGESAALWEHGGDAIRVAAAHPLRGPVVYASELAPLVGGLLVDGRGLRELDAFMRRLRAEDPTPSFPMLNWARVRGHRDETRAVRAALYDELPPVTAASLRLRDALFLGERDAQTAAAAVFLDRVARGVLVPPPDSTDPTPAHIGPGRAICWSTLWSVAHGETRGARDAIASLRGMPLPYRHAVCAGLIDVLLTKREGADARRAVLDLDSLVRAFPMEPWPYEHGVRDLTPGVDNLVVARLLAEHGDTARALAAIRRGPWGPVASERAPHWSLGMLPDFLREEGRFAAAVGDTSGAVRAYRQYLVLREDASTPRAEWEDVQRELRELLNGARIPVPADTR